MKQLHEYGIADEQSDIRAHVSLPGQQVLVYRTADMVELLGRMKYPSATATQPGVDFDTARGLLVPIEDIARRHILRSDAFPWNQWKHDDMGCKAKGEFAVLCVRAAIVANRFPLWVCGVVTDDREIDIQGTDIVVAAARRIQVKYDAPAYDRSAGGSGNVFIQTHECNPLRIY